MPAGTLTSATVNPWPQPTCHAGTERGRVPTHASKADVSWCINHMSFSLLTKANCWGDKLLAVAGSGVISSADGMAANVDRR
jgi:hypothetical protein